MIYVQHQRSELIAAANLAKALRLIQVRPQRVVFDNRLPNPGEPGAEELQVKFNHGAEPPQLREEKKKTTLQKLTFNIF